MTNALMKSYDINTCFRLLSVVVDGTCGDSRRLSRSIIPPKLAGKIGKVIDRLPLGQEFVLDCSELLPPFGKTGKIVCKLGLCRIHEYGESSQYVFVEVISLVDGNKECLGLTEFVNQVKDLESNDSRLANIEFIIA